MANTRLSEKIKVRRVVPCGASNEIFLAWINSRGGVDSYLFEAHHGVSRVTGETVSFMVTVENMASEQNMIKMIKRDAAKELTLIAPNVDLQTRVGLADILYSPEVYLLRNGLNSEWDSITGPTFQLVQVAAGRFDQGDTDEDRYDFNLSIVLQPILTLQR